MESLLTMSPTEYAGWLTRRTAAMRHNTTGLRVAAAPPVPKAPTIEAQLRENARYQATTPPDLARSLTETVREKALAAMTAARRPITNVNNRPAPRAASLNSAPPKPPSLIDAIQKQRNTK
jgi:hypothetical protein